MQTAGSGTLGLGSASRVATGLVVAAGRGTRFGGEIPKQYRSAAGKAVLRWSIEALLSHPGIATVQVVIAEGDEAFYEAATRGLALPPPVLGGATRQHSVRNGLAAPALDAAGLVLIHDAARPLLDGETISRLLTALESGPAAIAAIPVADTLKKHQDGRIAATIDRTGLWRAQTPQGFHRAIIRDAHAAAAARDDLTDDAAVAEAAGIPVSLVLGNEDNLKVTTPQDLARAEALLWQRQKSGSRTAVDASTSPPFRVGKGFDVHAFEPGEAVILCGLSIPHTARLAGHSDADVGLHALTDALLGAIAAGDIGRHFPPSDMRWKGGDSTLFLRHAAALVEASGYRVANVDVTLICERPKIGPHRRAMEARIAALLGIAEDCVSVKATTTERLGFTGREEGIAAEAVALLMR